MPAVFSLTTPQYTGYLAVDVGTSALRPFTGLTGATMGFLTFEGGPLRFSLTNMATAHSATGHQATAGDKYQIVGASVLSAFSVISPATSGVVYLSYGFQ
jgi:hypothetical protein